MPPRIVRRGVLSALLLPLILRCAILQQRAPSAGDQGLRLWSNPGATGPEAEIYRTWLEYLQSKHGNYYLGASQPSPLWLTSERERWLRYDLAGGYLPDSATPHVVEIQREPGVGHEYRVVTRFESQNENNAMRSRVITMTAFAVRTNEGWRFGNALLRLTRSWRRVSVGPITYVLEPGYEFDRARADRAVTFVDSLATAFAVPQIEPLTYFLTTSVDEVYRVMGLETDKRWGPVGGAAQPVNHLLFSGIPGNGESYRHELAHIVLMPLMASTFYFISEGVPTWLGGTTGMDFPTAARLFAGFLQTHPGVTLDSIMIGSYSATELYPAAGVFIAMAFDHGGVDAIKALYDTGYQMEEFRKASESVFGCTWVDIAAEWRARALSFSADSVPR